MQGWLSAALFAAGVKAAGSDLTQQRVVSLTNQITRFTGDGVSAIVDWTHAHDTTTFPNCPSFVQVKGSAFVPVTSSSHQVFICFDQKTNLKDPVPVAPPQGTPGT